MQQMTPMAPSDDVDLYDDTVIQNPWPHYARLRALGPVVWMSTLGNYAFTHYDVVRDALRKPDIFISGDGVAADDFGCQHLRGNTVGSDGDRHAALRGAMQPPLTRKAVEAYRPRIQETANQIVARCAAKGRFDAIPDLAQGLPLTIVRDLVGLPDFGRENMLKWAAAAFDVLGVQNARGQAARAVIGEMRTFIQKEATPDRLKPGSWTHRISEMARRKEIDPALAPFAIRDYMNPSLDTTISAIGHLIYQLAHDPDSFAKLKREPAKISNAVHEAIRLGAPIRSFSRHLSSDTTVANVPLKTGDRVMMLFASANRDETMFADAARFDIDRANARRHLGFGAGPHMCVGMHLALLEIECLAQAVLHSFDNLTPRNHRLALNNSICSFEKLEVSVS